MGEGSAGSTEEEEWDVVDGGGTMDATYEDGGTPARAKNG